MNRLIQIIIIGLTLCLPLSAKEAPPQWQIQGALAGFKDAVPGVKAKALDKLEELGVFAKLLERRGLGYSFEGY